LYFYPAFLLKQRPSTYFHQAEYKVKAMKNIMALTAPEIHIPPIPAIWRKDVVTREYVFPQKIITNAEGHKDLWGFHNQFKNIRNATIKLNIPYNCFLEANMGALLISICNKLKIENKLLFEIGMCSDTHLKLFLRNGLISHIENNKSLKQYDYNGTTIAARLFNASDATAFEDYIDNELLSNQNLNILDEYAKDMLRQGFLETFYNIEHIETDLPLAACGQCFVNRKKMFQFTLSDMGVGFLKKIRAFTNGDVNNPKSAIEWAVKGNSVRGQFEGGLGLSRLRNYCEKDKRFTFIIITDGYYWKLSDGKTECWSLPYQVVGTTIHLMVKLKENPMSFVP
jgi:hypothetical protein